MRAVGCVNAVSSTSNDIMLTGILGNQICMTPFESIAPLRKNLICMRYYEKSFQYTDAPANNGSYSTTGGLMI